MDFIMSLVQPLTTVEGWTTLLMLMFLEVALGVDNLVFISITTDRVKPEQQHIARRLGLSAAMIMRCILLCCVVWILSINVDIVTLPFGGDGAETTINVHDLVFLLGGAYLIYKGIAELREEYKAAAESPSADEDGNTPNPRKRITLAGAVGTIMVMDIVFSLDSVITAAGLSGQILVMCLAVILAVSIMIIFADPIANFINRNFEVKIVALLFITLVGVELVLDGLHYEEIAGASLSTMLYGMMIFGFATAVMMMLVRKVREKTRERFAEEGITRDVNHDGVLDGRDMRPMELDEAIEYYHRRLDGEDISYMPERQQMVSWLEELRDLRGGKEMTEEELIASVKSAEITD